MIETEGLTKTFGTFKAVNEVSFKVEKNEIFGLVGPDGAGKTTLMRMLCDIITPTSGRILLSGKTLKEFKKTGASFGYMPQKFSLYGDLKVMENIDFFGSLYQIDRNTIRRRADEILQIANMIHFKSRFADDLSGGMKQKLALTCALLSRHALLILDEPTFGVDPESRKEFWKILYRLNWDGMTILVSTSYMDEAELCKKIAFIDKGRIVSADTPGNLKSSFRYRILDLKADSMEIDFISELPEVVEAGFYGDKYHVVLKDFDRAKDIITGVLAEKKITVLHMEETSPSMEDVFVSLTGKEVV